MTAAFTMATLPLHSCRISFLRDCDAGARSFYAHDGDGAGFGAAVEANAATGAALAFVLSGMNAVAVQFRREEEHLGRTRIDAEAAAFAFVLVDANFTAGHCHNHLVGPGLKPGSLPFYSPG